MSAATGGRGEAGAVGVPHREFCPLQSSNLHFVEEARDRRVPHRVAHKLLLGKYGVPAAAAAAARAVVAVALGVHEVGGAAEDDGDEGEEGRVDARLVKGAVALLARVEGAQLKHEARAAAGRGGARGGRASAPPQPRKRAGRRPHSRAV